jgi:hypothetical protein
MNLTLCTGLKLSYSELGCYTVSGPGYGKYLALVYEGKKPCDLSEIKEQVKAIFEGENYEPTNSTVILFNSRMNDFKLWRRF